jgi:hypothetical protein
MSTTNIPSIHWDKIGVTNTSYCQCAATTFLVKENTSAADTRGQLCHLYRDTYMGSDNVRRWVKHFKDGNTNECNRQKVDALVKEDNGIAWHSIPTHMGDDINFRISESLLPLGSPLAYG